tara:strand:+ start:646 stop:981 length:336 start_codon:yes stop_codon:yes gene_type:complete
MATHRLLHVTRTGGGDTNGLAEFTNADTVLMPVHSSDPSETNEGAIIYNSTENTIKIYDGSAWVSLKQLTLVDEDNMASNSATSVPSQQSVKAYVDANKGASIGIVIALGE